MKKVPVWKGNDIGHGAKGGVLCVGSHDIKIGQQVPIELLSEKAIKSLRDKGAIVDEVLDDQKPAPNPAIDAVKAAKTNLKESKKLVIASNNALKKAVKSAEKQQDVFDNTPDDPSATKTEVKEALQALKSDVEKAQAEVDAVNARVDDAETALEAANQVLADLEAD